MLTVSEKGLGKRTLMDDFTAQNRGGKGVRCYRILEKTGNLVGALEVEEDSEIMMINTEGIIIRMSCRDVSVLSRITSGVKMMNLGDEENVACIARVRESSTSPVSENEDLENMMEDSMEDSSEDDTDE